MSFTHPNPGPRLATLYAVSFAAIGIYLPFFPLWLEHRALGALQIGIILAIPMVVRILVTAPLMSFIDRGIGARQLMVAANLAVAATYALLPFAADAAVIGVLVAALAVAQAPIAPITDLLKL
jgi:MFS transporter, PPP family, 3-phenylpropionic acid transporter